MNDSQNALDIVADALTQLKDGRSKVRASLQSLDNLRETAGIRGTVAEAPREMSSRRPEAPVGSASALQSRPTVNFPPVEIPRAPVATPTGNHQPGSKGEKLANLRGPVLSCVKCPHLVVSRKQVVFGVGNPEASLMFVGDAPGADEDLVGEPFVGKAGQLLTKIIEAMGIRRSDVYIAQVLKCRPDMPESATKDRKPRINEMDVCKPYLLEQIKIIEPRAIVALGAMAIEGLFGESLPIGKIRGQWREIGGIPLMPTFHPAYLERSQSLTEKRKVWEDMLEVMKKLNLPISEKQQGYFSSRE